MLLYPFATKLYNLKHIKKYFAYIEFEFRFEAGLYLDLELDFILIWIWRWN